MKSPKDPANNGDYGKLDSQNGFHLASLSCIEVILSLNLFGIPVMLCHIIRIIGPNVSYHSHNLVTMFWNIIGSL